MKRMMAFLLVLSLLSAACLGLAEEEEKSWKERLTAAADELRSGIQEKALEAAVALSEKAEQVSGALEIAKAAALSYAEQAKDAAAEQLEKLPAQASDALNTAKDALEQAKDAAAEQLGKLPAQASGALETAKDALEQAKDAAAEQLGKLPAQAAEVLTNVKNALPDYSEKLKELSNQASTIVAVVKAVAPYYVNQAKDSVLNKLGQFSESVSGAANSAKTLLLGTLSSVQQSAVSKAQALVNWLKGLTDSETPAPSQNGVISGADEAKQPAFFPVSGYGFYFGMTWAEARALNVNDLTDSRANSYQLARALVMLNEEKTSLYFLWFVGEGDDAYLFEVDEFAFAAQDTLIPPQDANDQYRISTTETTVQQVFAEKASSCAQRFGSAANLESGLLLSSLMFEENDAGISRTQVYFYEDQVGVIAVTHFVYTTDCGVNVIIYQYMGNTAE